MNTRRWPSGSAFLDDELTAFRPYEEILELDTARLDHGLHAHGWSARDVLSHLVGWHEVAAVVAGELVLGPTSPRKAAADDDWDARGDEINEAIRQEWRGLSLQDFRDRARSATAGLRAVLAEVPLERWWDSEEYFDYFNSEMQAHYEDHRADLAVVLGRAPV
jgi:hypothetical protein